MHYYLGMQAIEFAHFCTMALQVMWQSNEISSVYVNIYIPDLYSLGTRPSYILGI